MLDEATPTPGLWTVIPGSSTNSATSILASGPGDFVVQYCTAVGTSCESCANTTVSVRPLPAIGPFTDLNICEDTGPFALPVIPAGGIWSGGFVSGNSFDTDLAPAATYNIQFEFTDLTDPDIQCSHDTTITLVLAQAPTAQFTAAPMPACEGTPVVFTNGSIPGAGGSIGSLAWDFNDPDTGTRTTPSFKIHRTFSLLVASSTTLPSPWPKACATMNTHSL